MRLKLKCLWPCGVRVFSAKPSSVSVKYGNIQKLPSNTTTISNSHHEEEEEQDINNNNGGNKIMVVVVSSMESKGALQWALSHAVQAQDTVLLLLLHYHDDDGDNDNEVVSEMKKMCEMKRPGVKVKVVRIKNEREENEGEGIVREAKKQEVTLLVIGQSDVKKRYYYWRWWNRVIMRRKRSIRRRRRRNVIADYCIQNASCMTIAVRRKSKKLGGYLITTKRHKNFWLLA